MHVAEIIFRAAHPVQIVIGMNIAMEGSADKGKESK
jgi:hypothetical protein